MVDFRVNFATVNAANVAFPIKKTKWNSIFTKSSSLKLFWTNGTWYFKYQVPSKFFLEKKIIYIYM